MQKNNRGILYDLIFIVEPSLHPAPLPPSRWGDCSICRFFMAIDPLCHRRAYPACNQVDQGNLSHCFCFFYEKFFKISTSRYSFITFFPSETHLHRCTQSVDYKRNSEEDKSDSCRLWQNRVNNRNIKYLRVYEITGNEGIWRLSMYSS